MKTSSTKKEPTDKKHFQFAGFELQTDHVQSGVAIKNGKKIPASESAQIYIYLGSTICEQTVCRQLLCSTVSP
jgi:hypothetical protein